MVGLRSRSRRKSSHPGSRPPERDFSIDRIFPTESVGTWARYRRSSRPIPPTESFGNSGSTASKIRFRFARSPAGFQRIRQRQKNDPDAPASRIRQWRTDTHTNSRFRSERDCENNTEEYVGNDRSRKRMKNGPSPPFSQVSAAVHYTQWTYPTGFRSRTEDGFTVSPVFNGFVLESMERLNSESFVGKKKRSYAFPRTKFHEHRLVPSRDYHGRRNDKRSRDPDADALPESETNGKPQPHRDITATQHCFARPHAAPPYGASHCFEKQQAYRDSGRSTAAFPHISSAD